MRRARLPFLLVIGSLVACGRPPESPAMTQVSVDDCSLTRDSNGSRTVRCTVSPAQKAVEGSRVEVRLYDNVGNLSGGIYVTVRKGEDSRLYLEAPVSEKQQGFSVGRLMSEEK